MIFMVSFIGMIYMPSSSTKAQSQRLDKADSLFSRLLEIPTTDTLYLEIAFQYLENEVNYSRRLAIGEEALQVAIAKKDFSYQASFFRQLGDAHNFLGNPNEALGYYQKALDCYKQLHESEGKSAIVLNSIGILYLSQKNFELAKAYLLQALEIHKSNGSPKGNIAGDLLNLGEAFRLNSELDSAFVLFQQAKALFTEQSMTRYIPYAQGNIGLVKVEQGNYEEGIPAIDSATQSLVEYKDYYGIASFKSLLGEALMGQGNFWQAEKALRDALTVATNHGLKEQIRDASKALAEVYAELGRYDQAYQYQRQYIAYNDTLTNEENARELAEQRADYTIRQERMQNELEMEAVAKESRFRGTLAWVLGLAFSSIAILAVILYVLNQRKQLANQLLEEQKLRIEQKSEIIDTKNREITSSIEYASRIQKAMLPYTERIRKHFPEFFALLKPRDIVSGDFYWMQEVGDEVLLAVADCTGHGVPGALMSMLGISVLDELATGHSYTDPGLILEKLHEEIMRQLKQETSSNQDGMDISLIAYHAEKKRLRYAGAKLPLVYVQPNDEGRPWLTMIKGDRIFVGGDLNTSKPEFTVHELTIDRPTNVYLFTDGDQDQFGGPENKKFRPAKFRDLLLQAYPRRASGQQKLLDETFGEWKGKGEQLDDVLVVGLKL